MFRLLFTLDYEIHGNGDGDPRELLIEPTARMMASFRRYGAKITILADVAEILKFQEYYAQMGEDRYSIRAIERQLQDAVRQGHDVQLHLHTSYFGAVYRKGSWRQNYVHYDLARLPYETISAMVRRGKDYLVGLLSPIDPGYRCIAFRAANWSMHPSENIARALIEHGIIIDTSVFKGGAQQGMVDFDYADAYHALIPWPAAVGDVCRRDPHGKLFEFPIYCEPKPLSHFLTENRLYNYYQLRRHPLPRGLKQGASGEEATPSPTRCQEPSRERVLPAVTKKRPWKLDFNQCTAQQIIRACESIRDEYSGSSVDIPIVLIGHSKLYTHRNERDLERLLAWANKAEGFAFGVFGEFDLEAYRSFTTT